jgi:hypothetical protein
MDWALKRVFKFLLKRHLGRLLRHEVSRALGLIQPKHTPG